MKEQLRVLIRSALKKAAVSKRLVLDPFPEIVLERPKEQTHGDWATNIALVLASQTGRPANEIAQVIVDNLEAKPELVSRVEVAGPGFINFHLSDETLYQVLLEVLKKKGEFGNLDLGQQLKTQIEFVSANPVGPMHVGHGRWAAVGDSLANVMTKAGYQVEREFYINDYGSQMNIFGRSVAVRYAQALGSDEPFPEDGYQGEYIKEIAAEIVSVDGDKYLSMPEAERESVFVERAYAQVLDHIKKTLLDMDVRFDVWFSERTLHQDGAINKTVEELRKKKMVYDHDGAVWLKTTLFGDDKDRVLIRESGEPTYFAADIAYHQDKLNRGFKKIINIWGADHHGYVSRMKAAVQALGYPADTLEVIIGQMVNLLRGGEPVRMSKRTGEMVTLEELLNEVGKDAVRYLFLMRGTDTALDFDIELAKEQTQKNPVYYVQYAHARICSILRYAAEQGVKATTSHREDDIERLVHPAELDLLRKFAELPEIIESAALNRTPYLLTKYAEDLATSFHSFYTQCRVICEDAKSTKSRLVLVQATQILLQEVLRLLGVTAPERM
jgi:arginyl-tRNA synthetase